MFQPFASFNRRLGIDLGSCRTRIWLEGEGLVLDEASVLAVDQSQHKVIAAGDKALEMQGRVDEPVKIFRPVEQPKIKDKEHLGALLKVFFQKASEQNYFFSPSILLSLASNVSPVVRQAAAQVVSDLGAKEVLIVSQPLAAAIGSGVPVADASGCFVLHLGGGVVEAAAVSLGKMIKSQVSHKAGLSLDQHLQYFLRQEKQLKVSRRRTEDIKINLGTLNSSLDYQMTVSGNDLAKGAPKEIELMTQDIFPVMDYFAQDYQLLVKKLLATVPPDLTTDLIDKGLLLSGHLAQLDGLEQYLVKGLGLPVSVVDEPELAVIHGLGTILKHLEEFKQSLGYSF
jgi:rod shape-determining protein MreB